MADHKQDFMAATGMHRAWIGERSGDGVVAPLRSNAAVRPQQNAKGNSRHAAITRGLSNFPNYKTWAEKAKNNWQKDKPE